MVGCSMHHSKPAVYAYATAASVSASAEPANLSRVDRHEVWTNVQHDHEWIRPLLADPCRAIAAQKKEHFDTSDENQARSSPLDYGI